MTKIRIASALIVALLTVGLFATVASAQQGVTVISGTVTGADGLPAASGTPVTATTADGTQIGSTTTGASGLAANVYRLDIQASANLEGQLVTISALGGSTTVTFAANTATLDANISGTGSAPTIANLQSQLDALAAQLADQSQRGALVNRLDALDASVSSAEARLDNVESTVGQLRNDIRTVEKQVGPAGRDGRDGRDGSDGVDGAPGATGPRGPQGGQGAQGPAGAAGSQGSIGPSGDDGSSGLGVIALVLAIVAIVVAGTSVMMARRS